MVYLGDHVLVGPRITVRNKVRNTDHAILSAQLRHFLDSSKIERVEGNYSIPIGEPLMDQYLDRVPCFIQDPQTAALCADIVILSHSDDQPRTTFIDVTMAAHKPTMLTRIITLVPQPSIVPLRNMHPTTPS
jgi:hypothetical protein